MSLSNSQYDQLMRTYEQKQLDNEYRLRRRYEKIYSLIPEIKEVDHAISSLSVQKARLLLDGDETALSSLKEELNALSSRKIDLLVSQGFPADYLELHYSCPDCKDTGYIGMQKCHCFKKAMIDLLYTQSNLQDILEKENFSTCSLSYYSSNHIDPLTGRSSLESMQTALKVCHEFTDTFSDEFHNILLYGDTGVGKTFLSHCIAKELMDASYSVIYFTASQLFNLFADNTFGRKDSQNSETCEHIYDCDLLIIDDLGTELTNSFTTSQLFICLNERILRQKSTIISTNLTLEDIKSIYSERIFSRLSSNYTILRLTGDDIRIQKKLLNLGGTNDVTP
ncbi:MAG: ATP-binding protein [Dorea sp.]|nr:ATP-binding protein [Dorea sp.]MDY2813458.1 ATP-binding protein [Dorea sp.]